MKSTDRSDEQGIALVMALLMVLAVSVLTSSLVMVARSEATSSVSYTSMSQVRYGAESGIHAAANHLLYTYVAPTAASATDPLASFDMSGSPVRFNGRPVVLSSNPDFGSNYPVQAVVNAFVANSVGNLNVSGPAAVAGAGSLNVAYNARATLMSMTIVTDYYTQQPITLQTWQIIGAGRLTGSGASLVEVEATVERQPVPVFAYAAFATHNGCSALNFTGGATTHSYDSAALVGGAAVIADNGGNVGTNGSLDGNGGPTTINGTLSTPRGGVGNCTANNVTAATLTGWGTVEEGLITLPQPINLPTPPDPNPPMSNVTFNSSGGCPVGAPAECAPSAGGSTITPAVTNPPGQSVVQMGNVNLNGTAVVHLAAGIYELNSLTLTGNSRIIVDNGPVVIKIKGQGQTTPLDLAGGGVSNPSLDPTMLQFVYGGTGNIKITGGTDTAALIYAPNASGTLTGDSTDFYGAIVTNKLASTGGFSLNYDRRLQRTVMTAGNPTMTSFTWRTF